VIRFDRIELFNWDIQAHQTLPLGRGVTLVTGENGSGKTAILDAIKVGLGAGRLGGDRSTRSYLLKQSAHISMVRILVDNRRGESTRRRPFDPLGEFSEDSVTLAVVFRAVAEGDYNTEYYILDGDVVPLERLESGARRHFQPQSSRQAYRDRLNKVGIGEQYRRLLCLEQGQIASFCKKSGSRLFDQLFDIIGGKTVLDRWNERVLELNEHRSAYDSANRDLEGARKDLVLLRGRVARHQDFQELDARLSAFETARPHVELQAATRQVEEAKAEDLECQRRKEHVGRQVEAATTELEKAAKLEKALEEDLETRDREVKEKRARRDRAYRHHVGLESRFGRLEDLRKTVEGVAWADLEQLRGEEEGIRTALATGASQEKAREARRVKIREDLEAIADGLLPLPRDVEAFRAHLRNAGIPHNLLLEVVEVKDERWTDAVEGLLDRHRLAILPHDLDGWRRASKLAREHGYPHGVLAPDVRSKSPADDESVFALMDVQEPRYRDLIGRLMRPYRPREPDEPLEPPRHVVHVARDGFVVSRLEARVARADRTYLGRRALEDRKRSLETEYEALVLLTKGWVEEERRIRKSLKTMRERIAKQEQLRAWQEVQEDHTTVKSELAQAAERLEKLEEALGKEEDALDKLRAQKEGARVRTVRAEDAVERLRTDLEQCETERHSARSSREEAEKTLVRLREVPVPELGEQAMQVMAQDLGLKAIELMCREFHSNLTAFTPEECDPLLPTNYERQCGEVEAVESRLAELTERLEATKVAAESAKEQYQRFTRRTFRHYWALLGEAAADLDFTVEGRLEPREDGRFSCDVRVRVGDKPPVHHDSEDLSGGQKAALSILMGMTAVAFESESAGFFLIDEPFSASDVVKINELGSFLHRTEAQYLVSMPTTSDLERCGEWLQALWTCTKTRGGIDEQGNPRLAPKVRLGFTPGARDG